MALVEEDVTGRIVGQGFIIDPFHEIAGSKIAEQDLACEGIGIFCCSDP